MNRTTALRAVLVGAVLAIATVAAGEAVAAAPAPTSDPVSVASKPATGDTRATFGIKPFGQGSPDRRPWLSYSASTGAQVSDQIEVINYSYAPLRLSLYATDAFNTPGGGLDLLVASKQPTDVGTWIDLSRRQAVLAPRARTVVHVQLHVPTDATPGDHIGGLVASIRSTGRDQNGNRVALDQRVATRVYVRVAGPLHPALSIETLRADWQGNHNPFGRGRLTLTYRVHNTGNVRLLAHQLVTVGSPFGDADPIPLDDLPELLPGGSTLVTSTVRGLLPMIRVHAAVQLSPYSPPGSVTPRPDIVRAQVSALAIPWTLLALLAGLTLATARVLVSRKSRTPVKAGAHRRPTRGSVPAPKGA